MSRSRFHAILRDHSLQRARNLSGSINAGARLVHIRAARRDHHNYLRAKRKVQP